jgi:hypothetical protein
VVGYIALFCFVLGGTAIALPGKNKVDSGDIKKNAVRTSEIGPKAVKASKIAPRSVDGLRVIDNSLTGDDIDESTLNIRPAPSSIGPTELADRQRRLVFTPGSLVPGGTEAPELEGLGPFPILSFADGDGFASLSTDVPGTRVEGTKLTVRVIWSATGNGAVNWDLSYGVTAIGGSAEAATSAELEELAETTTATVTSTTFELPGSAIQNGNLLGVTLERDGNNPEDTLASDARVHLVEIDYSATG